MLLLLFTYCIVSSCEKKSIKNDLEKENLKGNIVSVKKSRYNVTEKFGEPVKGEIACVDLDVCSVLTKYNDFGNEIEFSEYDSFGISFITKVKYNEKNQKIEQNRYTPVEGKRVMQFKLKYDLSEGRIYFDDLYFKPSNSYTITAKSNQTIEVNASFLSEVKQENVVITSTDFYSRSSNYSRNTRH